MRGEVARFGAGISEMSERVPFERGVRVAAGVCSCALRLENTMKGAWVWGL